MQKIEKRDAHSRVSLSLAFSNPVRQLPNVLLQNSLMCVGTGVGPYGNLGQDTFPALRADRNEICAGGAVVVVL